MMTIRDFSGITAPMKENQRIAALIVAAGIGARMGGGVPKQYRPIAGKPMLRHALEALLAHPAVGMVQVVIHPDHAPLYEAASAGLSLLPAIHGGAQRADSVLAGLTALAAHQPDAVLVHDAARPFLSAEMLTRLIAALEPEVAVLPALPVVDTVRRQQGDGWEEVPRDGLWRMQTPQAFPFAPFYALHRTSPAPLTDDAALWLDAGYKLAYVEGQERLRKMTTAEDFAWAESQFPRRVATGSGYDVHALVAGDGVVLGGVTIAHDRMLEGHSDADVALHALTDALLGSAAAGDIGSHFPPSDPRWKGADSAQFVREAVRLVKERGGRIEHADLTLICEAPKIGPHRDAMRARIAALLDIPIDYISVKATTTEQLGFTGRREGIAAQATATVSYPCSN